MKTAIVAISDLHIGSHTGLCPEDGILLDGGGKHTPSNSQKMLIDFWDHFWKKWVPKYTSGCKKIKVVVNGDLIDGNHHQAVDLIPNVMTQRNAAVQILKPIRSRYPMAIVRGTEVHGGKSDQDTEEIAHSLDCEKDKETDSYSWWQYWMKTEGVVYQFAHHIGTTSSAAYETSAPMRELVAGLIESAQWGQELPDVFVRSHRHRYIPVSIPAKGNKDISLYITPAWQLRTPHVERIDRMRMPHIGGIIFISEDGSCRAIKKIYELPTPTINQM